LSQLQSKILTLTEEDLKALYGRVFNNDDGLLVLEDLRNRCFSKVSTVGEGGVDGAKVLVNEGRRQVVLHIETMLEVNPEVENKQED